jgi:hypothetical protein
MTEEIKGGSENHQDVVTLETTLDNCKYLGGLRSEAGVFSQKIESANPGQLSLAG